MIHDTATSRAAVRAIVVAALAFASSTLLADPPSYRVEVLPPLPGHDSVYPTDLTEQGSVIIANAGSDPFDPLAAPLAHGRGRYFELPELTDSLNFALGSARPDLIVGTSSNQPVAWVRGEANFLGAVDGMPLGFA